MIKVRYTRTHALGCVALTNNWRMGKAPVRQPRTLHQEPPRTPKVTVRWLGMNCENCGNLIDQHDAERGSCGHCSAVLAHVLRAAEKAELVRRVVAQGNDVRIDGDRIEARAPPGPRRAGPDGAIVEARSIPFGVATAVGITLAAGLYAYFAIARRSSLPAPPPSTWIAVPEPPVVAPAAAQREPAAPPSMSVIQGSEPAAKTSPAPRGSVATSPRTVDGVVAAHKSHYDRCQRAELVRNASAARRYSIAITVDSQGRAEWVELLGDASAEMRSCVQSVTRGLDFSKPAAGSSRSIVTLSFMGSP
jgi:hypothetical protein